MIFYKNNNRGGVTLATTNEEFIEWLEEQAIWVKDAALTYYEMGKFTEKDVERFATECIEEVSGIKKLLIYPN